MHENLRYLSKVNSYQHKDTPDSKEYFCGNSVSKTWQAVHSDILASIKLIKKIFFAFFQTWPMFYNMQQTLITKTKIASILLLF